MEMTSVHSGKIRTAINKYNDDAETIPISKLEAIAVAKKSRLLRRLCQYNLAVADLENAKFVGGRPTDNDDKQYSVEIAENLEKIWIKEIGVEVKRPEFQNRCICGQNLILWNCYWKMQDGRIFGKDGYNTDEGGGVLPPIGSCCVGLLWFGEILESSCSSCGQGIQICVTSSGMLRKLCLSLCGECKERKKEEARKLDMKKLVEQMSSDLTVMEAPIVLKKLENINKIDPSKARDILRVHNKVRVGGKNVKACNLEQKEFMFGKYKHKCFGDVWESDSSYCRWLYERRDELLDSRGLRTDGTRWYTNDLDSFLAYKIDDDPWVEEE